MLGEQRRTVGRDGVGVGLRGDVFYMWKIRVKMGRARRARVPYNRELRAQRAGFGSQCPARRCAMGPCAPGEPREALCEREVNACERSREGHGVNGSQSHGKET